MNEQTTLQPDLLKIEEVAVLLGISPRTVCRMDSAGKLPSARRLGRCKRWSKRELAMWEDNGCPPRQKWVTIWERVRGTGRN